MEWTPRLTWDALPQPVRQAIEERVGVTPESVDPVVGGFSAGFAGILRTRGRSVFVKATSQTLNGHGRQLYRRERAACEVLARHGRGVGLEWALDLGDWTALGFTEVEGEIYDASWPETDLREVLAALAVRRVGAPSELPALEDVLGELFAGWAALAVDASFDAWPVDDGGRRLLPAEDWCALAERARHAFSGDHLLHADLRSDNVLRTASGPVVVDWAYACRGNAAFDPVYLLLEVARTRGRAPTSDLDEVLRAYDCDPDDATALLAAFDGWFTWMSRQPPVAALPQLRSFQAEMAAAARSWVVARLQRPSPESTITPPAPAIASPGVRAH